ncbi:MAG: hypothetical protein ACKVTZ_12560 [Bacteroidia bacterium]
MEKTLVNWYFALLLGVFLGGCDKPDPPKPPYLPPTPFNWDTYDWKQSFYCHSPVMTTDSTYFHGFLDGKEVCIVAGKDGYLQGPPGLSTTNLGYMLNFGFGHESKDSLCLLYFYTPPLDNFTSVADYFTYFQLGDLPLAGGGNLGFQMNFEITYNVKENGDCNYKGFYTLGKEQNKLRLVEKEIVETDKDYLFYFKFEIEAPLYGIEKYDSLGNILPFGHITDGVLSYKTKIPK